MNACQDGIDAGRAALRNGLVALAIVAAAALAPAQRCHAGLVLTAQDVKASAGSSGSFDVLITNTNAAGGASYLVASDVLQVALTGPAGVRFTGVSIDTLSPYIFPVSGVTQTGGPFSSSTFPGTTFTASDSDFDASLARSILAGQTFGVAHVSYTVATGVSASTGMIHIVAGSTSLSDATGSAVAFGVQDGSFVVTAAVPAPPASLLTAAGLVIAALGRWRRGTTKPGGGRPDETGGAR